GSEQLAVVKGSKVAPQEHLDAGDEHAGKHAVRQRSRPPAERGGRRGPERIGCAVATVVCHRYDLLRTSVSNIRSTRKRQGDRKGWCDSSEPAPRGRWNG